MEGRGAWGRRSGGGAVVLPRPRGVMQPGQEVSSCSSCSLPYPQVNCLTLTRDPLTLWLPPGLPHPLAVRAVDEMLEVGPENFGKNNVKAGGVWRFKKSCEKAPKRFFEGKPETDRPHFCLIKFLREQVVLPPNT